MRFSFLGAEYEIERDALVSDSDWGECDHDQRRIKIARGPSPRFEAAALVHEIAHAVLDRLGKDSERGAAAITSAVEAIVKDNPEIVKSIVNDLTGGDAMGCGKPRGRRKIRR